MSHGAAVPLPEDVRAARGYVEVARSDARKGFDLSACLTAQRAAEVALRSWARARGMDAGADSLPRLLAAVPGGAEAELGRAARELERFRMDMHSPYRSPGALPDASPQAAEGCCTAAAAIVAHVEALFAALDEEPGGAA